jgi:hypothetical protein
LRQYNFEPQQASRILIIPIYSPGLVVFNTTSQQWSNITSDGYAPTGKVYNGAGHFVPSFGPNGLLLFMGGAIKGEGDLTEGDFTVRVS